MVSKLRRKFILTAMGALLVIVVILVAAINLIDLHQRSLQMQRFEERIASGEPLNDRPGRGGRFGMRPPEEEIRPDYFPADEEGFLEFHRETEQAGSYRLLVISVIIGLFALVAMFLLVWLFSGRAVAPVVESLEKQKRFITDAGHELKTPLAVISADIDVLEMDGVKNEWTDSIRSQVRRMSDLVKNMLALSRMEEEFTELQKKDVDFSALCLSCAGSFTALAESEGKRFTTEIAEGIHLTADAGALEQLVSILIDNALKYSSAGSEVLVRVTEDEAKRRAVLEVTNSVDVMPEKNLDRLFERFYRADASRNAKTGGAGIGLSAARAIAEAHDGKISAKADGDHIIRFTAKLPFGTAA